MSRTTFRRPGLATALAVLCAVVLIGGVAMGLWLRHESGEDEARAQERAEVVQAAQRFTVTWNTIDPKRADTYLEQVSSLVTDNFREEAFGDQADQAAEIIRKGGVVSDAKVLTDGDGIPLVGVSVIDPNSATVLVVADSQRRVGEQEALRYWRWQLELVKQDGQWLVDDLSTI